MVFLLKVSRATEQAGEETTLSSRQKNMLYSAEHMLKIYDDIMKPASDIFVNIINNADANNENLLNILENPLYQNSFVYVGNDNIHKGLSDEEIRELRCTGSLSSMLDQGRSLLDAMQIATAVAALEVQKSGAIPAMPYRNDVFEFLKEKGFKYE